MRKIKFRAWDKHSKSWIGFPTKRINNQITELVCETENIILMQFTGLKDKNGKEIFEGDILRVDEYNKKWDDGAIGDVDWDEESGGFRFNWKILLAKSGEKNFRKPISTICSSSAYHSKGIVVIGNKFENPELLDAKRGK